MFPVKDAAVTLPSSSEIVSMHNTFPGPFWALHTRPTAWQTSQRAREGRSPRLKRKTFLRRPLVPVLIHAHRHAHAPRAVHFLLYRCTPIWAMRGGSGCAASAWGAPPYGDHGCVAWVGVAFTKKSTWTGQPTVAAHKIRRDGATTTVSAAASPLCLLPLLRLLKPQSSS